MRVCAFVRPVISLLPLASSREKERLIADEIQVRPARGAVTDIRESIIDHDDKETSTMLKKDISWLVSLQVLPSTSQMF